MGKKLAEISERSETRGRKKKLAEGEEFKSVKAKTATESTPSKTTHMPTQDPLTRGLDSFHRGIPRFVDRTNEKELWQEYPLQT